MSDKMNLETLYKVKDKYINGEIDRAVAFILVGDRDQAYVVADALYFPENEYGADGVNEFNVAVGKTLEFVTKDLPASLYATFHTPEGKKNVEEAKTAAEKSNPPPKKETKLRVVE